MSWFVAYQSPKGCVSWQGHGVKEDDECRDFLQGPVTARLHDAKGYATLVEHLNGLSLAGGPKRIGSRVGCRGAGRTRLGCGRSAARSAA